MKKLFAVVLMIWSLVLPMPLVAAEIAHTLSTVVVKKSPWVDVRAHGSGSVTLAGVQTAVDAAAGTPILIPPGLYSFNGTVTLPATTTIIYGDNVTITQTGGVPTFSKTGHTYTELHGIKFAGDGIGMKYLETSYGGNGTDFRGYNLKCGTDTGVFCFDFRGANNPYWEGVDLYGGSGFYFYKTTNPVIRDSVLRGINETGYGVYYPGVDHLYSQGLAIRNVEIMGFEYGVRLSDLDLSFIADSIIDFNTYSVVLEGTDDSVITGNQFGNSVNTGGNSILLTNSTAHADPNGTTNFIISNNTFVDHWTTDNTSDIIRITGTPTSPSGAGIITGNYIGFYTRYGISFDNTNSLSITNNYFTPRSGYGVKGVYYTGGASGDGTALIANNSFTTHGVGGTVYAQLRDNMGHITRWSGVQATDNAATTWDVTHNLDTTPTNVILTATENHPVWVTAVGATTFTINTDNTYDPFYVYWTAEKVQGN